MIIIRIFGKHKDFIQTCEDIRDGLIDWSYTKEEAEEYMYYRGLAFDDKKGAA